MKIDESVFRALTPNGEPDWEKIQEVVRKLASRRIGNGLPNYGPEDVAASVVLSRLAAHGDYGAASGDPAFYVRLFASLNKRTRRVSRARMREGHGTVAMSKLNQDGENEPTSDFANKNFSGKSERLRADTCSVVRDRGKADEPNEDKIVEKVVQSLECIIEELIGELSDLDREVAQLLVQTMTIDDIVVETGRGYEDVKRTRARILCSLTTALESD